MIRRATYWIPLGILFWTGPALGQLVQTCNYDSIVATAPAGRFTDNGDGTVTDRATGLQWKRCIEGQAWDGTTCTGTGTYHNWQQALQIADGASYADQDDWRLPSIKELASIVEYACDLPAIDLAVFPMGLVGSPEVPLYYWSSTPYVEQDNFALAMGFWDGLVWATGQPNEFPVRLARGGDASAPVNDTGLDWWADDSSRYLASEPADYPGQDATYGRDATDHDNTDGHAGFQFTKLDGDGNSLPSDAASWSCVRDEVTGLVWEVKTEDGGLRDWYWRYTWYNPDPATNGGSAGTPADGSGGGYCFDPTRCDTAKFVEDVNQLGLCGAGDWRLPTVNELRSVVDHSRFNPTLDEAYFTAFNAWGYTWSFSPRANYLDFAWIVSFSTGQTDSISSQSISFVRLVRGGKAQPFDHIGAWRPGTRRFLLDSNGSNTWDGATGGDTLTAAYGLSTDLPVTGDWNGDGRDEIGVWRPGTRRFLLDSNGSNTWDGATGGDTLTAAYGLSTDLPVTGDWNGDSRDEIGAWRPGTRRFLLDSNGSNTWDGSTGGDTLTAAFGLSTDLPVTGDWNSDGSDEVGVWRPGTRKFLLDSNGNNAWDGTAGGDTLTVSYGLLTDIPVKGRW